MMQRIKRDHRRANAYGQVSQSIPFKGVGSCGYEVDLHGLPSSREVYFFIVRLSMPIITVRSTPRDISDDQSVY
jgi:hypothetical protein